MGICIHRLIHMYIYIHIYTYAYVYIHIRSCIWQSLRGFSRFFDKQAITKVDEVPGPSSGHSCVWLFGGYMELVCRYMGLFCSSLADMYCTFADVNCCLADLKRLQALIRILLLWMYRLFCRQMGLFCVCRGRRNR